MNKTRLTVFLLFVTAALASCPACVRKTIAVYSDPPGATVYIDGLEVGRTPVDGIPFDFYGTRGIAVLKEGHLCERRTVEIDTPWYSYFPIDIVSELIIPWEIRDDRYYYFVLQRTEAVEDSALIRHAHQTRRIAKARIDGARRAASYRPRAYVVEGAPKQFILFAPFTSPPRTTPARPRKTEPKKEAETAK